MEKLLTVEYDNEGDQLELHLNDEGIDQLVVFLNRLKENKKNDHCHLMTKDWGGNELSNERQNMDSNFQLINRLKLIYWAK